jgi:paraquat-inducible protein B
MSQKSNPTVIGSFVLVGIGLALTAGLILSSGRLFKETYPYVMVFDGDVSGLLPGAPVQYRGVTIGSVREFKLVVDPTRDVANVPVIVEFDPSKITYVGTSSQSEEISREVNEGLRAQLQSQSLVTGLQKIMLVERPDVEIQMKNILDLDMPEIPTSPNLSESLINELQELPLEDIVMETHQTLKNLNAFTTALAEEGLIDSVGETLVAIQTLSTTLEKDLPGLTAGMDETMTSLRTLMEGLGPVQASISKELPGVINSLETNLDSFFDLQENLSLTLKEIQTLMDRNSSSRYQLTDSLTKFTELAVKASQLLDYLERHPEALFTGKPE